MQPLISFKQGPSTLVEVQVTANTTGSQIVFPDVPQLRNDASQTISIRAIEIVTPATLTNAPSGAAVSPITELQKAVLVLYSEGWNKVFQIPLLFLNHIQDSTPNPFARTIREFNEMPKVDWNKSYINFMVAQTPTYSFLFNIDYTRQLIDSTTGRPIASQQ